MLEVKKGRFRASHEPGRSDMLPLVRWYPTSSFVGDGNRVSHLSFRGALKSQIVARLHHLVAHSVVHLYTMAFPQPPIRGTS